MSSIVRIGTADSQSRLADGALEPFNMLPNELLSIIFSFLSTIDLTRASCVNREWRALAKDVFAQWASHYLEKAFGAQKWAIHYGDVGEDPPLPADIRSILTSPCPFFPKQLVMETHNLVLIPSSIRTPLIDAEGVVHNEEGTVVYGDLQPLTLNALGELIQHPLQGHATKYAFYSDFVRKKYGSESIEQSYWVLMTKDVIPGGRRKNDAVQQALVQRHGSYRLVRVVEAVACIVAEFVVSGNYLYGQNPWTYIRCREVVNGGYPIIVEGCGSVGLDVGINFFDSGSYNAACALRKF